VSGVDVVTTGEALGLLLADSTGPLERATSFTRSVAGAESNVAVGLARLGHEVAFAGRVGADAAGTWVRRTLAADGVDVSLLETDPHAPTGLLLRDCGGAGGPTHVEYRRTGSAACSPSMTPALEVTVRRSRALFVSGITAMLSDEARHYVDAVLDVAEDAGVPVVLDPNIRLRLAPPERWKDTMHTLIPRCDALMVGADEAELLGLDPDPTRLTGGRTRWAVVKDGARGASMSGPDGVVRVPARVVPVVDVVGAGDAFTAGWISGWLRDLPAERVMAEAAVVAGCVVAARGDIAGLPSAADRDAMTGGESDVQR
jgi:2-dehydro-3-deoxygluconokinase